MTVKGKSRLGIYLPLLILLGLSTAFSLWTVTDSGAYLTDEGDWQGKAGQYRIGVIDYYVEAEGSVILDQSASADPVRHLVVPLKGGVRFYDPELTDASLRTQEFNEGATILKLRVVNRSDSLVEVSATLGLDGTQTTDGNAAFGAAGIQPLRLLALPSALKESGLSSYDYRAYVLGTLGLSDAGGNEAAGLTAMDAAFQGRAQEQIAGAVIRGSTQGAPVGDEYIETDGKICYYKDFFFLLWCEYGSGTEEGLHNSHLAGESVVLPAARLGLTMTVGQLD